MLKILPNIESFIIFMFIETHDEFSFAGVWFQS